MVTMEEVARASGFSRSTVSRVLNGDSRVREATRKQIAEVIERLSYHPHAAARSLASQRTEVIGLVIPRAVRNLFVDPYFPALTEGIAQVCNEHGYTLALFLFSSPEEETRLHKHILRSRSVDGVIVSSAVEDDPLVPQLAEAGMPFVLVGRCVHLPEVSYVDVDNVVGARLAVSQLLGTGRKRVGTIIGPLNMVVSQDRKRGYELALRQAGLAPESDLVAVGDFTEEGGYHAMRQLLPARPDAVFAASDAMAIGAMLQLTEQGLQVPGDIAVVGFDDIPRARTTNPPLTTIRQPITETGIRAASMLLDILSTGSEPPRRLILPIELVLRQSCGSLKSSPGLQSEARAEASDQGDDRAR